MTDKLWKRRVTVVALAVFAMLLGGNTAQAATSAWTAVASPSEVPGDNYLYGADSSDAKNVWAVGAVYPPHRRRLPRAGAAV